MALCELRFFHLTRRRPEFARGTANVKGLSQVMRLYVRCQHVESHFLLANTHSQCPSLGFSKSISGGFRALRGRKPTRLTIWVIKKELEAALVD